MGRKRTGQGKSRQVGVGQGSKQVVHRTNETSQFGGRTKKDSSNSCSHASHSLRGEEISLLFPRRKVQGNPCSLYSQAPGDREQFL